MITEIEMLSTPKVATFNKKLLRIEPDSTDIVLGCKLSNLHLLKKEYSSLVTISDIIQLMHSDYHEARLLALLFLVDRFDKGDDVTKSNVVDLYLRNMQFINNWDLVDISAYKIIGKYYDPADEIFWQLAHSKNVWQNRIAMVATFNFIKQKKFSLTLKLAKFFIKHNHHLIHKATGWMLREIGKQDTEILLSFLKKYHQNMPKIMLYYACERLSLAQKNIFKKSSSSI